MAAFDLEEQEQIENLKAWWKRWGNLVTYGLAGLLIAIAGYQYWQHTTATKAIEASVRFDALQEALQQDKQKEAHAAAAALIENYAGTAYATRGAIQIASVNARSGDFKSAKAQLEWVIKNSKEAAYQDLARLNLAGILLDEKQYEAALAQVNAKHTDAFGPRFDDLKGDIYMAQAKKDEARSAYSAAYAKLKENNALRNLVELKLDYLGGPVK